MSRFSMAIISNNLSQQFLDIYVKSKIGKRRKFYVFVLFLTSKSYFYSVEKTTQALRFRRVRFLSSKSRRSVLAGYMVFSPTLPGKSPDGCDKKTEILRKFYHSSCNVWATWEKSFRKICQLKVL